MAIQDLQRDETLLLARAFLAERAGSPDGRGDDGDDAIIDAIRSRGWEPEVTWMAGEWTVEIVEAPAPTQTHHRVTSDPDLTMALLRALGLILTWLTPEEERQLFDEQARQLVGMSGEEFMRRWQADEVDADDPTVRHLLMLRPIGR